MGTIFRGIEHVSSEVTFTELFHGVRSQSDFGLEAARAAGTVRSLLGTDLIFRTSLLNRRGAAVRPWQRIGRGLRGKPGQSDKALEWVECCQRYVQCHYDVLISQ